MLNLCAAANAKQGSLHTPDWTRHKADHRVHFVKPRGVKACKAKTKKNVTIEENANKTDCKESKKLDVSSTPPLTETTAWFNVETVSTIKQWNFSRLWFQMTHTHAWVTFLS